MIYTRVCELCIFPRRIDESLDSTSLESSGSADARVNRRRISHTIQSDRNECDEYTYRRRADRCTKRGHTTCSYITQVARVRSRGCPSDSVTPSSDIYPRTRAYARGMLAAPYVRAGVRSVRACIIPHPCAPRSRQRLEIDRERKRDGGTSMLSMRHADATPTRRTARVEIILVEGNDLSYVSFTRDSRLSERDVSISSTMKWR